MKSTRLLLCLSPVALLAACGGSPSGEESGTATGEVLEGTISDAMLPLDRVRSQAPLAPRQQSASAASDEDEDQADGTGAEGGEEAETAPADEPAPAEAAEAQD